MGHLICEGTLFRFEEISASSLEWEEFRRQYSIHGLPSPEVFEDDVIRVIYFREKMMGGYIMNRRHMRYQSYIDPADTNARATFEEIVWDRKICGLKRVISINCLWRRQHSGILGRLATITLYLSIRNHASYYDCTLLAGAANSKLKRLYRSWSPALSFSYTHRDGASREMFVFHAESAMSAITNVAKSLFLLKWAKTSKKSQEIPGHQKSKSTRKATLL